MAIQTFKLVSPFQELGKKDYEVSDPDFVDPDAATVILPGEYVALDASHQLVRGSGGFADFAVFVEMGRSDIQVIAGNGQLTVLQRGTYEAETLLFNTSSAPALGAKLEVATVTYSGKSVSGLQTHAGGAKAIVGIVLQTAANNNDYLRFLQTLV